MNLLPQNTISKLYFFDTRIKSFYEKHGHTSMPFDGKKVLEMIEDSEKELYNLFYNIWGHSVGTLLLDKFYSYQGNILEFYGNLDYNNRSLFLNISW